MVVLISQRVILSVFPYIRECGVVGVKWALEANDLRENLLGGGLFEACKVVPL